MILLREIRPQDIDALERFAQIPGFINLPNDRDLLKEKIDRSVASFNDTIEEKTDAKYIFVAEDGETGKVIGTSLIAAQHGTPDSPHFYFEIGSEERRSESIGTGFIHGTLKLKFETNGPSEIGGLVIDPEYRNTDAKLGRQISFVRFFFLAQNRARFKKKLIAELLPPLNKKGLSPLWEAIGRRFTNMDYWEADQLCQKNKEFILSLFPSGKIYTTFLTPEARNAIGKVGKETEPVMHMLKKIGFVYKNEVDPFDGGPHLWANVDDLKPVQKVATVTVRVGQAGPEAQPEAGLLAPLEQGKAQFRAAGVQVLRSGNDIAIQDADVDRILSALELKPGDSARFMPYY